MSESIDILIQAENKASGTLKAVSNDVAALGTKVKATGQQVKASTELAGAFARSFGGSALGAFASELAGITEKVSAFSEISKTGAAGALALKVGIAGAVAVGSFKIGEQIGAWVFETERWKKELEAAAKAADKAQEAIEKNRAKRFAEAREDISVERGDGKERATQEQIKKLERESAGMQDRLKLALQEVAERKKANDSAYFKGNSSEELKIAEKQLADLKQSKQAIDDERQALADSISERAKSIEAKKQENALADKSDAFLKSLEEENAMLRANKEEQLKIEAARNTTAADRPQAEALLKEREALKAKVEEQRKAEQEAEQAARKEADAIQRIADLEKKRMVDLEAKRIELEKGREAAAAYRLEQEGLSKATAERLASQEEQQRQAEEAASGKAQIDSSPQQALQGRLLASGTGGDPMIQAANKQISTLERLNENLGRKLDDLYEEAKKRGFTVKTATVP